MVFDDFKECLFSGEEQMREMNVIRSKNHDIYLMTMNKIALSANDDKRKVKKDRIHTLALR